MGCFGNIVGCRFKPVIVLPVDPKARDENMSGSAVHAQYDEDAEVSYLSTCTQEVFIGVNMCTCTFADRNYCVDPGGGSGGSGGIRGGGEQ